MKTITKTILGLMVVAGSLFAENKIYFKEIITNGDEKDKVVISLSSYELNKDDMDRLTIMIEKAQKEFSADKVIIQFDKDLTYLDSIEKYNATNLTDEEFKEAILIAKKTAMTERAFKEYLLLKLEIKFLNDKVNKLIELNSK